VPVRAGPRGPVLAILVAAYRLSHFQHVVDVLSVGEGVRLTITDQHGVFLAQPAARSGLRSLRRDPLVAAALAGASGVRTVSGPDGSVLSAFRPIPALGWTVSSSAPTKTALAGIGTLRATVASIAAGLALLLLLGAAALGRSLRRRSV